MALPVHKPDATMTQKSFPYKFYTLLEDAERCAFDDIVSWQVGGRSFIVHNSRQFTNTILPKYFDQTRYKSFLRQLNIYDFVRIHHGPNKGGYTHRFLVRGQPQLCKMITRIFIPNKKRDAKATTGIGCSRAETCFSKSMLSVQPSLKSAFTLSPVSSAVDLLLEDPKTSVGAPMQLNEKPLDMFRDPTSTSAIMRYGDAEAASLGDGESIFHPFETSFFDPERSAGRSFFVGKMPSEPSFAVKGAELLQNLCLLDHPMASCDSTASMHSVALHRNEDSARVPNDRSIVRGKLWTSLYQDLTPIPLSPCAENDHNTSWEVHSPSRLCIGMSACDFKLSFQNLSRVSSLSSDGDSFDTSSENKDFGSKVQGLAAASKEIRMSLQPSTTEMLHLATQTSPDGYLSGNEDLNRSEAVFPAKLYRMLSDAENDGFDHIISFIQEGSAFKVHDIDMFVEMVLPKYFDQTKFPSFRRQLNLYGFTRFNCSSQGTYYFHDCFRQDDVSLLSRIVRPKIQRRRRKAVQV